MKVVIVCGAGYVSGKEIISLGLLKSLQANGWEVACIMSEWSNGDFEKRLREARIFTHKVRIGFISKTFRWSAIRMTLVQACYMPYLFFKYSRIIKEVNPDVVIHTNFHHLFMLLPVVGKPKQVYWSHEIITDSRFYHWLFHQFESVIDVFVGVSEAVSTSIRKIVLNRQVITIRNGSPLQSAKKHSHDHSAIDQTRRNFAIIGQVAPHKGHLVLFEAIHSLRHHQNIFLLHIIGAGDSNYIAELKQRAENLNISHLIRWRGFISDMEEIYHGIDCVIVPTIRPEPLGLIIMEAALRGIPSIGSDTGGIPELIIDNYNGLLFRTGNADDLKEKLEQMLLYDITKISSKAAQHAQANFGESNFVATFMHLLTSLCNK